jgi:organic hydroperoxide reductase OsmC/OhrA
MEQVKDYTFTISFDKPSMNASGPNASRILASAVGHCLSASLLFCLEKSRIPIKHVTTRIHTTLARNEAGRWRVQRIDVTIKADPQNEQDRERMERCVQIFEDFCIVTQSVRKGIDVNVRVET